jgi:hypothetical protein
MGRASGFAYDDTPQARLDKLDAVLVKTSTQDAALFAEMLLPLLDLRITNIKNDKATA